MTGYEWMENPENGERYAETIPPLVFEAIGRYVKTGSTVGGFVSACLHNNLADAVFKADPDSLRAIRDIAELLYNEIPSPAWGSPAKVAAWREKCAEVRA